MYDAIYVVGGQSPNQEKFNATIQDFIRSHQKSLKPITFSAGQEAYLAKDEKEMEGILLASEEDEFAKEFVKAIAKKRFWNRA